MFIGITPFTLIDYPGEMAAVFFMQGCSLRCRYCHNPALVTHNRPDLDEAEVIRFLEEHQGKLTGIVISGGDPLFSCAARFEQFVSFIRKIKEYGYKVKLDTNAVSFDEMSGSGYPQFLSLFDAVGLDIKAPQDKYRLFCPGEVHIERVHYFIEQVKAANIALEMRTTVHKSLLSFEDLVRIKEEFVDYHHHDLWVLQQFHKGDLLDNNINNEPTYTDEELIGFAEKLGCRVRGVKED